MLLQLAQVAGYIELCHWQILLAEIAALLRLCSGDIALECKDKFAHIADKRVHVGGGKLAEHEEITAGAAAHRAEIHDLIFMHAVAQESCP